MLSKLQIKLGNKILFNSLLEHKESITARALYDDYHVGTYDPVRKRFTYTTKDRKLLDTLLDREGVLNVSDFNATRVETSSLSIHEKRAEKSVIENAILFRTILGKPKINGIEINMPLLSHLRINHRDISSIHATSLIVIENLEAFNSFTHLMCPELTGDIIALFRGGPRDNDVQGFTPHEITSKKSTIHPEVFAYSLKEKTGISLIGYFDFDLAGMVLMTHDKYDFCILPSCLEDLKNIKPNQDDFRNQVDKYIPSDARIRNFKRLSPYLDYLLNRKGSYVQERLLAFNVSLSLIRLISTIKE